MTLTQIETPPAAVPQASVMQQRWIRPAVGLLLAATAALYLWGLSASGWANAFYSAAVQAGATSWKAFFYGSFDGSSFITVDKTPASLWIMDISARIFGVNSWSILVPQALEGVAAVGLLYLTVRRWFGPVAGLIAGAALALTPVAVLMFRFNNPDALLTLLLIAGAYAVTRALEVASTRWLLLAGTAIGFAFLTKMLQALLVVPAFGLVYLIAAPTPLRRRLWQLAAALGAMIVAAGWWVATVSLVPAADRPYIGGSQHNSILELALGYNGFGRLTGNETGSVGGGGAPGGWGPTGWTRLFNADLGGQAAWLLPAALLLLGAGLWLTRRSVRTDRTRAAFILWGGWLLVTAAVFSFMQGIFHPYYLVALAPAIAALVGTGGTILFRERHRPGVAAMLAICVGATALTSYLLLSRVSSWAPWLSVVVIIGGLATAAAMLGLPRMATRAGVVLACAGLAVALVGPAAYALNTAATPHSGAIPSAGPAVTGAGVGGGPGGGLRGGGLRGGGLRGGGLRGGGLRAGRFGGAPGGPPIVSPGGGFGGGGPGGFGNGGGFGGAPGGVFAGPGGIGGGFGGGPGGGLLNAGTPSAALVTALRDNASSYRWVAATIGSNNAAGYQLASGEPVMSIGGFNGSDPAPSLAQFQAYVAAGAIHYYLGGVGFRSNGGSTDSEQIASWVASNFTAQSIGGTTVYDLSGGTQ